jgi:hypothetical protein
MQGLNFCLIGELQFAASKIPCELFPFFIIKIGLLKPVYLKLSNSFNNTTPYRIRWPAPMLKKMTFSMKKIPALLIIFSAVFLQSCAELKEAGRTIGHTTRNVTREIGHGTRDVAKEIGHGTRRVVNSIGEETEQSDTKPSSAGQQ